MNTGLLWFDDSPARSLSDKVLQAAQRYLEKFGDAPNTCHVHPSALSDGEKTVGDVRVSARRSVLPHHFWIGVETKRRSSPAGSVTTQMSFDLE